jgi:phospholipase C
MTPISRRGFVGLGATVAAGMAMGTGARPAVAAQQGATGTISDVKHVVILMQENRSFDHYFGRLKGVRGFDDRSGITLSGGYPVFNQPNGGGRQYPWKLSATPAAGGQDGETLAQCNGDLPHSWSSQHSAWNKGRLDNWVSGVGNVRSLGYLDRADIPFHYALADNYTICDAYFCSTLSATGPNRTYLWSGKVDSSSYDGGDESGLTWQTYAESLQNAGVTWKVYQNAQDNYGDNACAYFKNFTNSKAGSPLYDRGMSSVPAATGSTPDDIAAAIKADVLAGTLPQVSWVVPNQAFSEHPYAPPGDGAHFVSRTSSTRPSCSSTTTRTTATSTTSRHPPRRPAPTASSSTACPMASASASR